jgi:ribonuclease-3
MPDWSIFLAKLGINFNNLWLLQQALVHRSYLHENPGFPLASNERLEFFGDAWLGFVVAEALYQCFPELSEGEMTKLRAVLVSQEGLAQVAESLNLGDYLYLGQGEEKSGGRKRPKNLAGALEALIGAIYFDQGFAIARDFVLRIFDIQGVVEKGDTQDYKSILQELVQAQEQETPKYRLLKAEGPDHDREFIVGVVVGNRRLAKGRGKSKRAAEKEAAREALKKLGWGKAAQPNQDQSSDNKDLGLPSHSEHSEA